MAMNYIVFAILFSTALGEFDLESLPGVESTKGAKPDDTVNDRGLNPVLEDGNVLIVLEY